MGAFLFSVGLSLFVFLVGFAVLARLPPRLRIAQGILVSPAVGIAATILPVFFIYRAGIPVKDFGHILFGTLVRSHKARWNARRLRKRESSAQLSWRATTALCDGLAQAHMAFLARLSH